MKSLIPFLSVAQEYRGTGLADVLAHRVFWHLRERGADTTAGWCVGEGSYEYLKRNGFQFESPEKLNGYVWRDISSVSFTDVPEFCTETLVNHFIETDKEMFPDDVYSIPMTFLQWTHNESGEVVAKARFKVIQ